MNTLVAVGLFWIFVVLLLVALLRWVLAPLYARTRRDRRPDRRTVNIAVFRGQAQELEQDHRDGLLGDHEKQAARAELAARLARDALTDESDPADVGSARRGLGFALAAAIPALALGLYLLAGDPGLVVELEAAEEAEQERERKVQQALAQLEKRVDEASTTLEENVRTDPDDGVSWTYLANAYIARDRWEDAETAYARAHALMPESAVVVSGYAETLAVNAGRELDGRPIELVREALMLDPEDPKALELAGIHAYQKQEYATAGYYWNQLMRVTPEDTPAHAELAAMVRRARTLGHTEAFGDDFAEEPVPGVIRGRVEVAPDLVENADPEDTVYLFAETPSGAGAPLAALSTRMDQLPVEFTLDDSLAISADQVLSNHESITLVARVSRHGESAARAGDLEGTLHEVPVGSADVVLVIDTVRR